MIGGENRQGEVVRYPPQHPAKAGHVRVPMPVRKQGGDEITKVTGHIPHPQVGFKRRSDKARTGSIADLSGAPSREASKWEGESIISSPTLLLAPPLQVRPRDSSCHKSQKVAA